MQQQYTKLMLNPFQPRQVQTRKSFKSHQELRRNCARPILCISALFMLAVGFLLYYLCLPLYHFPPLLPTGLSSQHGKQATSVASAAEAYLQTYCQDGGTCRQQNIEALTAILSLMENSHSPQIESQTAKEEKQTTQKAQKAGDQPEIATNGLQIGQIASEKYKIERVKHDSGHSKLVQLPLQVVKHPKVTTPAAYSLVEQLTSLFAARDAYQGIDRIVEGGNWFVWRPNTAVISISVRSNRPIKPTAVEVIVERVEGEQLELIGLSITLQQRAVLTSLGMHRISKGINRINCMAMECQDHYDALIFRMGPAGVINIKVFEAVQVMEEANDI